jgi:ketosteroid isomerase-like protein
MIAALLVALTLAGAAVPTAAEKEVRDAEARFNAAYAANDMAKYWPFYDAGLTQWWPDGRVDLAKYKADWTKLLADGGRVLQNDLSDMLVQVSPSGDAAVASYRARVVTRQPDGRVTTEDVQETDVWFKKDGAWRVVHLNFAPKLVSTAPAP